MRIRPSVEEAFGCLSVDQITVRIICRGTFKITRDTNKISVDGVQKERFGSVSFIL